MLQTTKIVSLLLVLRLSGIAQADVIPGCENRDNMYISVEGSCSRYIFCFGDESFEGDCDDDTPYFSEDDQTCDSDPDVCKTLPSDGDEIPSIPEEPSNPVVPPVSPPSEASQTTAATPAAPPIFSTTISSASSPVPSQPPSSTQRPTSSKPTSIPTPTTTAATNVAASCPLQDDPSKIVFLQHTKSCSDYFMCYHGEPLAMHCSHMLHFDIKTQKCDYPENVKCQLDSGTPREKCQAHTVDVFPHPSNCNYYYLCRFGYLMVMQCPINMNWDYTRNACIVRGKANCYSSSEILRI